MSVCFEVFPKLYSSSRIISFIVFQVKGKISIILVLFFFNCSFTPTLTFCIFPHSFCHYLVRSCLPHLKAPQEGETNRRKTEEEEEENRRKEKRKKEEEKRKTSEKKRRRENETLHILCLVFYFVICTNKTKLKHEKTLMLVCVCRIKQIIHHSEEEREERREWREEED